MSYHSVKDEVFFVNDVVILEKVYEDDLFYPYKDKYEDDLYVVIEVSCYSYYLILKRLFPQEDDNFICIKRCRLKKL